MLCLLRVACVIAGVGSFAVLVTEFVKFVLPHPL